MILYDPVEQKKNVFQIVLKLTFLILLLMYFTSCANIFGDLATKTSEEALIQDIKITMKLDNAAALVKFQALSASVQAKRENQFILASIYGGLCGINFFDLTTDVGSDPALMRALIAAFPDATSAEADFCILGESTLTAIGDETVRTVDENLLMVYMTWGKIGTILEAHGDPDGDDDYSTFDPCSNVELPDNYAKHLLTGIAIMSKSFTSIGGGSGTGASQGGAVDALCTALPALCSDTDISTVDATEMDAVRELTKDGSVNFGLGIIPVCANCC